MKTSKSPVEHLLFDSVSKLEQTSDFRFWKSTPHRSRRGKRILDILVGGSALLALSPLMLGTAAVIKLQDRGPVFFRQIRVGENGRRFGMLKFRSMVMNAEARLKEIEAMNKHAHGVTFKIEKDPRITPFGRFIRKFSIDELPQLINVLRGEMSLVGPRPPIPREVAKYESRHLERLMPKPGITCYWQVGGRANIDFEGQVELDKKYRRTASFWTDIKLLFLTIPAVLMSKGSY